MGLGRKLFYDKVTGLIIVDTGQWDNAIRDKTVEEEIQSYKVLYERSQDTFGVLALEYRQYQLDFEQCNGYRVNTETLELEFQYFNPNEPEVEQPYQESLSVEVARLKAIDEELSNYMLDIDMRTVMIELGL